jgi:hypothetical protein
MSNKERTEDEIKWELNLISSKIDVLKKQQKDCLDELACIVYKDKFPIDKKIERNYKKYVVIGYACEYDNPLFPRIKVAKIKGDGSLSHNILLLNPIDIQKIKLLD